MIESFPKLAEAYPKVKSCNKCGGPRVRIFRPTKSNPKRWVNICITCQSAFQQGYREKNKARIYESQKAWLKQPGNRERCLESYHKWLAKNPEFPKQYVAKNKESVRERSKAFRESNKDRIQKERREKYRSNAKKIAERNAARKLERAAEYKKWSSTPRARAIVLVNQMKRRSAMARVPHTLTGKQISALMDAFKFCIYCGSGKFEALDHVHPVTKGGHTSIENMAPACKSCNSRKKNSTLDQWMQRCDLHIYPMPRFPLIS